MSSSPTVLCSGCETLFKIPSHLSGQTRPCPVCKTPITFPAPPIASEKPPNAASITPVLATLATEIPPRVSQPEAMTRRPERSLASWLIISLSLLCTILVLVILLVDRYLPDQKQQSAKVPIARIEARNNSSVVEPLKGQKSAPLAAPTKLPTKKIDAVPENGANIPEYVKGNVTPALPVEARGKSLAPAQPVIAAKATPRKTAPAKEIFLPILAPNPHFDPPVSRNLNRFVAPKLYGSSFTALSLSAEKNNYVLATHWGDKALAGGRILNINLKQLETTPHAEKINTIRTWINQLNLALHALEIATQRDEVDQLFCDIAALRTCHVHLGVLMIYMKMDRDPEHAAQREAEVAELASIWQKYLETSQKFYLAMLAKSLLPQPLHRKSDNLLMDELLKTALEDNVIDPAHEKLLAKRQLPALWYAQYRNLELLGAYFDQETVHRRITSPQTLLNVLDLQLLCGKHHKIHHQLRYDPRHNRAVTGLRVGVMVHTQPDNMELQDHYQAALPQLLKPQQLVYRPTPQMAAANLRLIEEPYRRLVAELQARLMLGQFGHDYSGLHAWDQGGLGTIQLHTPTLSEGLATAWSENWDYAIIIQAPSPEKRRFVARLVDLLTLEELAIVPFVSNAAGWSEKTESWGSSFAALLQAVDEQIVLQHWTKLLPENRTKRIAMLPKTISRESLTSLLVEFSFYQNSVATEALQALEDLKPGLKEVIPLLRTKDDADRAPLIIRAAELSLPPAKAYTAIGEFYDLPPSSKP